MLRIFRFTLAVLAFTVIIGWATPATAEGNGSITGQLVNNTDNGTQVGGVEVSLIPYLNGKPTAVEQKVVSDKTGMFEFNGLSTDNESTYVVSVNFQNAEYVSREITLTSTNASQAIELEVYDSTTSDENLRVSAGHMVVYVDQGDFEILEIWRISNLGDKTFIGAQGNPAAGTLRFNLPEGAVSMTPGVDSALETVGTEAVSTVAVPPGDIDVDFGYYIHYQGPNLLVVRKTDYTTDKFSLLVQDAGVNVTSTVLTEGDKQMMNGTSLLYFTAGNLTKGVDLDASFSGIVKPSEASSQSFLLWPWLVGGLAALGLVAVVAYSRSKKQPVTDDLNEPDDENELLAELARLDDDYEAGKIDDKDYHGQRARVKASLLGIYVRSTTAG